MLHTIKNHKATFLLITIWTILYLLGKRLDLLSPLAGQGIDVMGREYYRLVTGSLLHSYFIHLLVNIIALYWTGYFTEQHVGSIRFFFFGLMASTMAQVIFSCIYHNADGNTGGSPWVFSYIGLIFVLQLLRSDFPRFHLGTRYGNWIFGYCILGNLPFLFFVSWGTVVIHLCAFIMGGILGVLGICLKKR